jgi:hypothetical protein
VVSLRTTARKLQVAPFKDATGVQGGTKAYGSSSQACKTDLCAQDMKPSATNDIPKQQNINVLTMATASADVLPAF